MDSVFILGSEWINARDFIKENWSIRLKEEIAIEWKYLDEMVE